MNPDPDTDQACAEIKNLKMDQVDDGCRWILLRINGKMVLTSPKVLAQVLEEMAKEQE